MDGAEEAAREVRQRRPRGRSERHGFGVTSGYPRRGSPSRLGYLMALHKKAPYFSLG